MKELLEQAILFYNLPLTVLLGLVGVFWILSLLGAVEIDAFDFDFDPEVEGAGEGASDGVSAFLMRFVNAQDVPVMIIFSLLTLFMWAFSIAGNAAFNPDHSALIAGGLLFVNFLVSAILVKVVTQPLRPLMKAIKNDQEHQTPLIGMSGTVKSRVLDVEFGQVEIIREKGAPALLNAILPERHTASLVKGDQVLVVSFDEERDKYLVHPMAAEGQIPLK